MLIDLFLLFISVFIIRYDGKPKIVLQILWAASIYLEAVAILPQLVLLQRSSNIDNLTGTYVFLLGFVLRALYHISCDSHY